MTTTPSAQRPVKLRNYRRKVILFTVEVEDGLSLAHLPQPPETAFVTTGVVSLPPIHFFESVEYRVAKVEIGRRDMVSSWSREFISVSTAFVLQLRKTIARTGVKL